MAAVDQSVSLDEKTRRVRSLLSSYYGVDGAPSLGGSPKSEQSDTPSARSTSRMAGSRALAGLDSPAFDVERYLRIPTHGTECIIDYLPPACFVHSQCLLVLCRCEYADFLTCCAGIFKTYCGQPGWMAC